MKKQKSSAHKGRDICLLALLAALCIGSVELTVSYFFAPALFYRVTAPLRSGAKAAVELAEQAAARWSELTAPHEELSDADVQIAGEPALSSDDVLSDPSLTELRSIDGQQILTGGTTTVVYFNQSDPAWADKPYGSDDIGRYGCGPTAMAMVVSTLGDETVDPAAMADAAARQGYCAKGRGSYLSIVNGIAQAYGLHAQAIRELSADAVYDALLNGEMLVALMGPGHFTRGGHFIVLRGVTLTGTLLVADPASEERSLLEWPPDLILNELSSSRSNGAPLWVLSKPEST